MLFLTLSLRCASVRCASKASQEGAEERTPFPRVRLSTQRGSTPPPDRPRAEGKGCRLSQRREASLFPTNKYN